MLVARLLLCVSSLVFTSALSDVIPVVTYRGDSHYDFGYSQGHATAALVADRFSKSEDLAALLSWYEQPGAKKVRDQYWCRSLPRWRIRSLTDFELIS